MKQLNKFIRTTVRGFAIAVILLIVHPGFAATFQWTNTSAGAFLNAANWTNTTSPFGNGVPGTADTGVNNLAGSTTTIGTGDSVLAGILHATTGTISVTDGDLTATTVLCNGNNGTFAVSGGVVNLANLQITASAGVISISGGVTTVSTDCRIATANGVWNVSGGTLNASKLTLGSAAAGNVNNVMTISGNAVVTQNQGIGGGVNRELWIGGNNAGSGTLIIKDNATWTSDAANASTDVIIGRTSGSGQTPVGILTVQDNASLVVQSGAAAAKIIQLAGGPNDGAIGIVNLNGGNISTIGFARARSGTSTGTINVNGGKVTALAANANFFRNFSASSGTNAVNLQTGGLTFDANGFAVTITNTLSGAGGFTKTGAGTLTLTASNAYAGATIVNNGTLALTGLGSVKNSSSLSINTATLDVAAANPPFSFPAALTLTDATVNATFANTNLIVGTLGTAGTTNVINITTLPNISSVPATIPLMDYTTAAPGLVDGGNLLTTLGAILPTAGSPVGYLTNNVANGSIDLVITSMVLAPVITVQPMADSAYTNFLAHFSVELESTNSPGYQWRKDGTPLSNGGHFSGVNTAVLRISNASSADIGNYDVVITNVGGSVTSSAAGLTLRPASGYEAAALGPIPAALYMFDEVSDPATGTAQAYDYAGDLDGVYGIAAQNGHVNYNIAGPRPGDGFPGFDATNIAARFAGFTTNSNVRIPALNLNTNTVTLTAWINPGLPAANAGIIFCRGGGTVAGMNITGGFDPNNTYRTLGYTWNNDAGTFGWNSQIAPTPGQWSFVALVITPTNATVYIFDVTGVRAASQSHVHANQSFSTPTYIGDDPVATGNRQFDGSVEGVGVYGRSLTQSELEAIYAAGSGVSTFPPVIWAQPASVTRYEHQTAVFSAQASGSQPLSYQWKYFDGVNYTDINNSSRIAGATSSSLAISNLVLADAGSLVAVVTNVYGAQTSIVATLTVNPTVGPAQDITTSVIQPSTDDWDTPTAWSLPGSATDLSGQYYGSRFIVLAPGGLRTPHFGNPGSPTSAAFPGEELRVEGNGSYDPSLSSAGGVRIKGGNPSTVYFKKLVLAGGQLSSILNSGWAAIITGELNVISNSVIWAADDTSPRSITIQSALTGNGNVTYHAYNTLTTLQTNSPAALNIANANNPYTGTWNVELGMLVGSAPNALGTNNITVGAQGGLQTTYDINNPNGSLVLNGRMNLTQNDTFRTVTVNGNSLAPGTYTFAQLNAAYPANFPPTWVGSTGAESFTTASGSITVLASAVASNPTNIMFSFSGNTLSLNWPSSHLGWIAQSNSVGVANDGSWFDIAGSQSTTSLNVPVNASMTNVFYRLRRP